MKFRVWCIEHNYTARQIAELTNTSVPSIFAYWRGTRKPTRARERLFKEKLGIPDGLFD